MAVKRSLAWMAVSQGASFAIQFGASIVVARLLTPYELGVYAIAVATIGALSVVQSLGLGNLIVRDAHLSDELVASIYTINSILSVLLSIAIAMFGLVGQWVFHDHNVRNVLLVMAPVPLCQFFDFLPAARFERAGNFKAIAISSAVRSISNAVLTVAFAVLGFKFIGLAIAQDLSIIVTAVYFSIVGRQFLSFRIGLHHWRYVLKYGLQMMTISGLNSLFLRAQDIVLGKFLGISALGIFNRAASLNSLLADKIRVTIERIIFSHFAAHLRSGESLREPYIYVVELMTAVLWPAFGGLAVLSAPLIHAIYGARWGGAATPLSFLAVSSIIQVSISLCWEIFLLRGELVRQSRIEFIRSVFGFAVFALACRFGLAAAAVARILESMIDNLLYRKEIERMTGTRLAHFIPIYVRSGILTAFAVAPALVFQFTGVFSGTAPIITLIASVLAGVCLWTLGLVVLKHSLVNELVQPLQRLLAHTP